MCMHMCMCMSCMCMLCMCMHTSREGHAIQLFCRAGSQG
jgi:hypothetical protein